jgi:hypothetical protein
MGEELINVIELLATHEETISQLYACYAERFPDHKEFWSTLSEEELEHAKLVRQLSELYVQYDETKLRIPLIKISMDHIKYQLAKVQKEEVSYLRPWTLSGRSWMEKSSRHLKDIQQTQGVSCRNWKVLSRITLKEYRKPGTNTGLFKAITANQYILLFFHIVFFIQDMGSNLF